MSLSLAAAFGGRLRAAFAEPAPLPALELSARDLAFPALRLRLAHGLLVWVFFFPFFNFATLAPGSTLEINFLPAFLGAALAPELAAQAPGLIALGAGCIGFGWAMAGANAAMRLAIGIVPVCFIFCLTARLRGKGCALISPGAALTALRLLTGMSLLQTINLNLFPLIPAPLVELLGPVIPRYASSPYDLEGIRGVQGWASEPSSAALMASAFALVALAPGCGPRRAPSSPAGPARRPLPEVLLLLLALFLMNKSIYCLAVLALFLLAALAVCRRRRLALPAALAGGIPLGFYVLRGARMQELVYAVALNGFDRESNHELMRFAQILGPLQQFPHIYIPPVLFGDWVADPMGLLPLVAGFASVPGLVWLGWLLWRFRPFSDRTTRPLALAAAFLLCLLASPDFIPSIVALAAYLPADPLPSWAGRSRPA